MSIRHVLKTSSSGVFSLLNRKLHAHSLQHRHQSFQRWIALGRQGTIKQLSACPLRQPPPPARRKPPRLFVTQEDRQHGHRDRPVTTLPPLDTPPPVHGTLAARLPRGHDAKLLLPPSCSCLPPFPISPVILGRLDIRRPSPFRPTRQQNDDRLALPAQMD